MIFRNYFILQSADKQAIENVLLNKAEIIEILLDFLN